MQNEMTSMRSGDASGMDDNAIESENVQIAQCSEPAVFLEKPAISELQAAAAAFSTAFSMALHELEQARRELTQRSARIDELNEAVSAISSALDEEVDKGRSREASHQEEAGQLRESMQAAESERDGLQGRVRELEALLDDGAAEISGLHARLEELAAALEQSAADGQQAQEESARERDLLTARLDELQGLYDEAGAQLQAQREELEVRNGELATFSDQAGKLQAEVEAKCAQLAELESRVTALQGEIDSRDESHARASEDMNARIASLAADLESSRAANRELEVHAEKLENLNQALHESAVAEKAVHRKQLDEKVATIDALQSRLEAVNPPPPGEAGATVGDGDLQQSLQSLESRLQESEARNRELGKRAEEAERLEILNGKLRAALNRAREYVSRNSADSQGAQSLQERLEELRAELEASRAREKELADSMQDHEELAREVVQLRENTAGAQGLPAGQGAAGAEATLQDELEQLRNALAAAEERCRQLEAAPAAADRPGCVVPAAHGCCSIAAVLDRSGFVSHLEERLAAQDGADAGISLMYVLLDHFIQVRDEIGVMESEQIIREVAEIIATCCGTDDTMARFGDCTFAVLCSNQSIDAVNEKAERIRSEVEGRIFEYGERSVVTTTSIGICSIRKTDTCSEAVVSRADLACETARLSGGNRVMVNSALADQITLEGQDDGHAEMIRRTITEDRIKLYYQPISSLREHVENHFEVLVRIVDESGKIILPGEFFSMAEASGQAGEVDRFVIDSVMRLLSGGRASDMTLFIKLTRQSVADGDLPEWVAGKIAEYGVRPQQLVFEVAEAVLQSELNRMSVLCKALNELGCKVAVEHYQMATRRQHLMHVHADYLKIDRSLIENISRRGESLASVAEIMDLAKQNGYITIAEGVENPASLTVLWELGVGLAQGYFIQPPAMNREYDEHGHETRDDEEYGKATFEIR